MTSRTRPSWTTFPHWPSSTDHAKPHVRAYSPELARDRGTAGTQHRPAANAARIMCECRANTIGDYRRQRTAEEGLSPQCAAVEKQASIAEW